AGSAFETRLFDTVSGKVTALSPTHAAYGDAMAVTQDGSKLARASWDSSTHEATVESWALPSGRHIASARIPQANASSGFLAVSPDGNRVAICTHRMSRGA